MKKAIMFCIAADLLLVISVLSSFSANRDAAKELFSENVAALQACSSHTRKCGKVKNACLGKCPICEELVYVDGVKGPASGITGEKTIPLN